MVLAHFEMAENLAAECRGHWALSDLALAKKQAPEEYSIII